MKIKSTKNRIDSIKVCIAAHELKRALQIPQGYRFTGCDLWADFLDEPEKHRGKPIVSFTAIRDKAKRKLKREDF